jgi:hypothetical protein
LLEAQAGGWLGGSVWRDELQRFQGDGHDTTLL